MLNGKAISQNSCSKYELTTDGCTIRTLLDLIYYSGLLLITPTVKVLYVDVQMIFHTTAETNQGHCLELVYNNN